MLIKDIKPDAQSINIDDNLFYYKSSAASIVKDRETLKLIVDPPCLEACEYLFDCNILTINSSANKNDVVNKNGCISINYDSLSDDNKKVYQTLVDKKIIEPYSEYTNGLDILESNFTIEIPVNEKTTSEEFSEKLMKIVSLFGPQELLYGSFSKEEMKIMAINGAEKGAYMSDEGEYWDYDFNKYINSKYKDGISTEELINEYNNLVKLYYYDDENDRYWISEELYKKSLDSRSKIR